MSVVPAQKVKKYSVEKVKKFEVKDPVATLLVLDPEHSETFKNLRSTIEELAPYNRYLVLSAPDYDLEIFGTNETLEELAGNYGWEELGLLDNGDSVLKVYDLQEKTVYEPHFSFKKREARTIG